MTQKNGSITPQEAMKVLKEKEQNTIAKCAEEINKALNTHGCTLVPVTIIAGTKVESRVEIVINDK